MCLIKILIKGKRELQSVQKRFPLLLLSLHAFPLLQCVFFTGTQFPQGCLSTSSPWFLHGGKLYSDTWSTSSPSFSDLGVPSAVSPSFCPLFVSVFTVFCPFLNIFSQRCHAWLAGSAVSCSGSAGVTRTYCGPHRSSPWLFPQKPPQQPLTCQHLDNTSGHAFLNSLALLIRIRSK